MRITIPHTLLQKWAYVLFLLCSYFINIQDEVALVNAAGTGDVSAVRRLIATHVNVDCAPYQVVGGSIYVLMHDTLHIILGGAICPLQQYCISFLSHYS